MSQTIVFIHGAWVGPRCWDRFEAFFSDAGYRCVAPAWPYLDGEPAQLRRRPPAGLASLGVLELVEHYAERVRSLREPPILVGHSFGGLIVQMLLDRGVGSAGVAIHSAPPRGVLPDGVAVRSSLPVLTRWRGWSKALVMSRSNFARDFANGLPPDELDRAYERYTVPTSGRLFFQASLSLLLPSLRLDFANVRRPPLLLLAGTADRTISPRLNRRNYRAQQRAGSQTDFQVLDGRSHWTIAEPGWERPARVCLDWLARWAGGGPPASTRA